MNHKKDLISTIIMISIISMLTLSGCAKKNVLNAEPLKDSATQAAAPAVTKEPEVKKVSKDEIQKAIEAYKKVLSEPHEGADLHDFVLVDLNGDRIPEMFGGSYAKEFNPINLAMSVKDGSAVKLSISGDNGISGNELGKDAQEIGLVALSEMKLYRNEKSNSHIYIGKDVVSRNINVGSGAEYEITLNDTTLNVKQVFFSEFDNEDNKTQSSYRYLKNQVSKSEFDTKHSDYYGNLKEETSKTYKGNIDLSSEQSINQFLEKGFLGVTGESFTLGTKPPAAVENKSTNTQTAPVSSKIISSTEAVKLVEKANAAEVTGRQIQYVFNGDLVYDNWLIDGKPDKEYYEVYGKENGQRVEGAFYVHKVTGKVYFDGGAEDVIKLPEKTAIPKTEK